MEKKDIFTKDKYDIDDIFGNSKKTLSDVMKEYETMKKTYEENKAKVALLNDEIKEQSFDVKEMNLKTQSKLYSAVDRAIASSRWDDNDELIELRKEMNENFEELKAFRNAKSYRDSYERSMNDILRDEITFDFMDKKKKRKICCEKHFFIKTEDELKCIACGATTKDYDLTKEELDFLTKCASKQCILLKDATEKDIPLIQLLLNELEERKERLKPLEEFDDDHYLTEAEERYLSEESEVFDINLTVDKSHRMDSKIYTNKCDSTIFFPKYLDNETAANMLNAVNNELINIDKTTNEETKKLKIEMCNVAKYEILILAGYNIPTLFKEIEDEKDYIYLAKAYGHLRNSYYRENSSYFKSERDAIGYDCYTAIPEINELVTKMSAR